MFPTRSTDMKKTKAHPAFALVALLGFCHPGYAWFWMEDPLYGSSYDTSRVKFPKLPPAIASKCHALDGSVATWTYGTTSTSSATYYIVNRALSRIPGETDLVEPGRGMLLKVDKSGCRSTHLLGGINGYAVQASAFPDSFIVPDTVAASLSRSAHATFAKAFGGFDRYKRQIRRDILDTSALPGFHWRILDSMSTTIHPSPKSASARRDTTSPVFPSMYEPVFATDFDATRVHFEPVGMNLRIACDGLPKGLPWWIFAHTKSSTLGEVFILSGLLEIAPDGPSREAPILQPDFGVVALLAGGKCDLVNIDNGLSWKQGDVANDPRYPLPDSTIDALAKDLAQRYRSAFGGKRALFRALGKDSLGSPARPAPFGQALRNLQEP
jgi:hypothetical protein